MNQHKDEFPIKKMCQMFTVSASRYYEWVKRPTGVREERRGALLIEIKKMYDQSEGRYGSPRITSDLRDIGHHVSRPLVARIMKSHGIRSIVRKKYRVRTTDSDHPYPVAENLLQREFSSTRLGEKWVSDLTYIKTDEGWLYLTTVIDLADRKVIGWALSTMMNASATTIAALKMAIVNRPITARLLFHSDRGVQYACQEFRGLLQKYPILQSMSRKGECYDNAVAESFFKTLKTEMVYHHHYKTILEAKRAVFHYIEVWYNRKRKHSSLGYKTPVQMEEILSKMKLSA